MRVKICCIKNIAEAKMAINSGASALGLVGHMPSGPGVIDDMTIKEIAQYAPPPIATFLLTSEISAKSIIAHHKKVNTSTIQIVDKLTNGTYEDIRQKLPMVKLVQVIHVIDQQSVEEATQVSKSVDALLLDSGNPTLQRKELGGTGRTHNWKLSRQIVDKVNIPVFLAGGLNAANIVEAIEEVRPFGVDLCSSVRTNDNLDQKKLENFMFQVYNI
jgi:phosphoribosylanthranilate isomerase